MRKKMRKPIGTGLHAESDGDTLTLSWQGAYGTELVQLTEENLIGIFKFHQFMDKTRESRMEAKKKKTKKRVKK